MATHSSILAWRMPWTEEPCGLCGEAESDTTKKLTLSLSKKIHTNQTSLLWGLISDTTL